MSENKLEEVKRELLVALELWFGSEVETTKKLQILVEDCERRLKRRVKPSSILELYDKYFDVLFDMVKIDYQLLGTEGELSRDVNGIKNTFSSVRPSDEILSKIPQNIGVRR